MYFYTKETNDSLYEFEKSNRKSPKSLIFLNRTKDFEKQITSEYKERKKGNLEIIFVPAAYVL